MALNMRGATTLLQVYDMPTSVRFYRDVLGFAMVSHSPHRGGDADRFHWCWLAVFTNAVTSLVVARSSFS